MMHSSSIKKQNNSFANKKFSPKRILEDFGYVDQQKILLLMIPKFAFYHLFPRKTLQQPDYLSVTSTLLASKDLNIFESGN